MVPSGSVEPAPESEHVRPEHDGAIAAVGDWFVGVPGSSRPVARASRTTGIGWLVR